MARLFFSFVTFLLLTVLPALASPVMSTIASFGELCDGRSSILLSNGVKGFLQWSKCIC